MPFELDDTFDSGVNIKVIGVGGGGNNAVNRMISANIRGVDFIAINTDKQALTKSNAPKKITIGEKITKGHGAGANPDIGAKAADESVDEIKEALSNTDMVFITTGMGGGTGTGATPIVAKLAQELGILTIGVVTKPFLFEGKKRMEQAELGIENLRQYVDSLVIIPNERLKQATETKITLANAFEIADDVLSRGVQSISELISESGFINLDFADVSSVMRDAGYAHMGIGEGTGKDKAMMAAKAAISSPLLETSINGAMGILISLVVSPEITLEEVDVASNLIIEAAHPEANVIWGATFDPALEDKIKVTIIATGFDSAQAVSPRKTPTQTTVAKPGFAATKPQVSVKKASASTVNNQEEDDEVNSALSDSEFDELIKMFPSRRNKDNNSNNPTNRRY